MNAIESYHPGFVDVPEQLAVEFNTIDDLLSIPFVEKWRNIDVFYRYSKSSNCLMAELDGGQRWYVIGYLKYPELIDLPEWKASE